MITIKQIDNVWMRIIGPYDALMKLRDHFTFEVPNAEFIKRRLGIGRAWDGKIRLLRKDRLYIGLLPEVCKILSNLGYKYILEFNSFLKDKAIEKDYIEKFIDDLNLSFSLRDYQKNIIIDAIQEKRATIVSATSSGKSVCIYGLVKFWYEHLENPKILIIVPSINLVEQLRQNFIEYSANNNWGVEDVVTRLYFERKNKDFDVNAPVTISTWQSVYKLRPEILSRYNMILFDEVHVAKAKEISKFLEKLTGAAVRYGFTGTLDDEKLHHFIIEGLFGPVINAVGLNELIDEGYATPLKIFAIKLNYGKRVKRVGNYQDEISYIINSYPRNKFIIDMVKNLNGNSMILFSRISHGKDLYSLAKREIGGKKNIYLIYGETEAELREQARQLTIKDHDGNSVIIASIQIFSVGVDIPSLKNLILAHPTKSKIRLLQSIGRILRKHQSKDTCIFFDLGDSLYYTQEHFLQRLKYYINENLTYKVKEVDLNEQFSIASN